MMEVKGLKLIHHFILQTIISLSQVFSNKSLPNSKIISRFKSSGFETFQFCKAGKIISICIFLLLTFYTRSLSCLIF